MKASTDFPASEPRDQRPPTPPSNGFRPFSAAGFEATLPELFARAVREHGPRTAVVGTQTLTYSELDERSARAASRLRALRGADEDLVAILAGPDVTFVVAAVGALRAGVPFVPLDPHQNDEVLFDTLGRVRPRLLVVDTPHLRRGRALGKRAALEVLAPEDWLARPAEEEPAFPRPEALACVFHTSGSTGEPVGVRMDHGFLSFDICRQTNDLSIGHGDRLDLLFSPAFSASLAPTFGALVNGAELHLLDLKTHGIHRLPGWLEEHAITLSNQSTSTMRAMLALLEGSARLPRLRLLCVGGEPLRRADCLRIRERLHPGCLLQNAMASTETRTYAQLFLRPTDDVEDPVPVGYPVLGRELRILDEQGAEQPVGSDGEVVLEGQRFAGGYHRDPERTEARLRRLPDGRTRFHTGDRARIDAQGRVVHLGRADSLVKVHGYRIDLAEIERHLRALGLADEALALAYSDGHEETAVGVAMATEHGPTLAELRERLVHRLPSHALPTRLLTLPSLPRNGNDKLDRPAIRARMEGLERSHGLGGASPGTDATHAGSVEKADTTEELLTRIWSTLLDDEVSPEASFFDLGGDSILAVALLVEIEERLGTRLGYQQLVDCPSARRMAALIESGACVEHYGVDLARGPKHVREVEEGATVYLLPAITGHTASLANLAEHSTRAGRFRLLTAIPPGRAPAGDFSVPWVAGVYRDEIRERAPRGPVALVGFSWGGFVAHELACQLREAGTDVRLLAILDARLPMATLPSPIPRWRRLALQLANLPAWIRHDLLTAGGASLRHRLLGLLGEARRARSREGGAPELPDLRAYFGRSDFNAAFESAFRARFAAALQFRPRMWNGATLVLRARAQSLRDPRPGALGWEHFTNPAPAVLSVPGHHESILVPPNVRELVAVLDRHLERLGWR